MSVKRFFALLLAAAMFLASLVLPVSALQPGDPIGWVLYTDVTACIDGCPIRSYNISGSTYIVVEDLADYGFDVQWLPGEKKLLIHPERTASPEEYRADYIPPKNTIPAGTIAMPYLYTEITTWIGDTRVTGCNIGGYTCIGMDDLAAHFAEKYIWNTDTITLEMITEKRTLEWGFVYDTPGYDKDIAVNGEYAVWEFEKNESGGFSLIHSEGSVLFTPQIAFSANEFTYKIQPENHPSGAPLKGFYTSALHTIRAHEVILEEFQRNSISGTYADTDIYPERFAEYCTTRPDYAEKLRENAPLLRQTLRVWYNDEEIDGIGLYYPSGTPLPTGTMQAFTLLYSRSYALEEVDTVRIELKLPLSWYESQPDFTETIEETMDGGKLQSLVQKIGGDASGQYTGKSYIVTLEGTDVIAHISVKDNSTPCLTRLVTPYGTKEFEEPITLYGNFNWHLFQLDGIVVFDKLYYGVGDTYVFWEGGSAERHDSFDQKEPTVYLYMDTRGRFVYCRRSTQYAAAETAQTGFAAVVYNITSREDFWDETGTVSVADGELVLTPETIRTVSDVYDLDAEYAAWRDGNPSLPETIDEMIAQNKNS